MADFFVLDPTITIHDPPPRQHNSQSLSRSSRCSARCTLQLGGSCQYSGNFEPAARPTWQPWCHTIIFVFSFYFFLGFTAFDPVRLNWIGHPSATGQPFCALVIFDVALRNGRCCMLQHFKRSSFNSKFIQLRRQGHCGFKARPAGYWRCSADVCTAVRQVGTRSLNKLH